MFDGSFKSARKVNLSGRRKPTAGYSARIASLSSVRKNEVLSGSKEEFLLHNRLAREERQALKLRAIASLRIQSQYRRFKAAEQARIDVFTRLAQQVTQTIATQDIQYNAVPTTQLQLYVRQFLFARAIRNRVGKQTIRRMQDYVVVMLLVNSSRAEDPDSLVNIRKDATWVYQMARMCEIALETLVEKEIKTSMTNIAMAGGNPYVLLLEALIYGRYTSTRDGQIVQSRVLYYISVTARYSVFDAMSACIVQERKDNKARFETDLMVQLLRIASQTLQVSSLLNLSIRENAIRQVFASKMLLTPAAASSRIVHCVAKSVSTNSGLFWASIVQEWCNCSDLSILSWHQRVIVIGNVVELTTLCSFEQTLVTVVSYVLSELIRPSLCHWAFDVKGIEHKDRLLEDEDAMNDPEVLTSPRLFMTSRDLNVDKEIQHGIVALGESEGSVHAQWQLLCHSSFSARCLDILLRGNTAQMHDEKNAVALFCHTLSMILLSTGRSYVLNIAAQFTPPSAAIFALLSSMTVEQFGGTLDGKITDLSLVNRLWMWIKLTLESVRAQRKGYVTNQFVFTTSQMHVLLVFNVVYSHTLLGLDDETFYDKQWPLVLTEVMDVVTFLKQLIYETCWMSTSETSFLNDCMSENEVVRFSAVVSSIKLFNQLYDRDCRRPFMPESAWLWPLMPVVKEIVDLGFMKEDESRDTQAIFMLMTNKVASPFARAALILVSIPQVLSFNERVQLFQKLLEDSKAHVSSIRDEFSRALVMKIKRDEIVDMSFFYFKEFCDTMSLGALKLRMKIIFINEQGLVEAGIDGGGVFKEYMDCLTKNAFAPELGLFLETEAHLLYPNPSVRSMVDSQMEAFERYRFLGRVLAKAVYENILVEPQFAAFFLNKLLGKLNYIDDLHSFDPALYTSLMRLKHFDGNVEDLALTFSVTENEFHGVVTRNLVPNGENIPVTTANRIRYIHLMAHYKLNVLSSQESAAFLKGFRDLIPGTWIQMFSPTELQMLIGGTGTHVDIQDWKEHTVYGGGYHPSQRQIEWFWAIVKDDFTSDDRAALLKFITSCSRQPLLGFAKLTPKICIHQVRVEDNERLPSSATCMNLLKLPAYSSKEAMRKKLLYAIRSNAGFDLS